MMTRKFRKKPVVIEAAHRRGADMMPVEHVRWQLELKCTALGSQKRFSQKHHVSLPYVNDVLNGRREPGEKILKALKMKRVTGYVYVSKRREHDTEGGVA